LQGAAFWCISCYNQTHMNTEASTGRMASITQQNRKRKRGEQLKNYIC